MRLILLALVLCLTACVKGPNPLDPYEPFNRKVHDFNLAFDATFIRPPARLYQTVIPSPLRRGINNAFLNINMIPTIANDILQANGRYTIRDSWRFFINSTFGLAGFIDVAKTFGLPLHENDLGLTFAKWGYHQSAYLVLPILGPSTFRDTYGLLLEYPVLSPYSYFVVVEWSYGLMALRSLDLRSQLFETEKFLKEALDSYTFMRDAYLQNRDYRLQDICPNLPKTAASPEEASLYVEE